MKIKRGDTEFNIDVEIGKVSNIYYRHSDGDANSIVLVAHSQFLKLREGYKMALGRPIYACLYGKRVLFMPAAAHDGAIEISYYPPLQKI